MLVSSGAGAGRHGLPSPGSRAAGGLSVADRAAVYDCRPVREATTGAPAMSPPTIRVDLNRHGAWEITLPVGLDPINCKSRDEARTTAYRFAAGWHPCEVVMCDAYHRVVHRELIDSFEDAAACADQYLHGDLGLC